jgi:hypothetical protein
MRNPPRKAAIFAGLVVLGIALVWTGAELQDPADKDAITGVTIAIGGTMAFMAAIWLIKSLFHVHGMARLKAGFGRVAMWHVSAAEWDKFRAADDARALSDLRFLVNDLWIRKRTPPEGVDVVIGEKSLVVDGSYHVLRMNGLPELRNIGWVDNSATPGRPPDCIEFLLAYPRGRYGGIQHTTLRVPVPAAALEQGRKAFYQFAPALERRRAKGPIALRNPRRTLQVCGVILLASIAAAGWGWLEAERTDWNSYETMTPIILLTAGGVGAFFAVFLGGLTLLMRSRDAD